VASTSPSASANRLLTVVDLADVVFVVVADGVGMRWPRPRVADGAVVGSVPGCSAW
jgi:beta-phosphoglucomutase-like phosphatase (HAD superfamily)